MSVGRYSDYDVLAKALSYSTLDLCVYEIQRALGISSGDVAGQEFSNSDRKIYTDLRDPCARARFISSWFGAELLDAAYRVDEKEKVR